MELYAYRNTCLIKLDISKGWTWISKYIGISTSLLSTLYLLPTAIVHPNPKQWRSRKEVNGAELLLSLSQQSAWAYNLTVLYFVILWDISSTVHANGKEEYLKWGRYASPCNIQNCRLELELEVGKWNWTGSVSYGHLNPQSYNESMQLYIVLMVTLFLYSCFSTHFWRFE